MKGQNLGLLNLLRCSARTVTPPATNEPVRVTAPVTTRHPNGDHLSPKRRRPMPGGGDR